MRSLFQTIFLLILLAGSALGLTRAELQASYEARCLRILAERDSKVAVVNEGYLKHLDKIGQSFQKSGNLNALNLLAAEKALIEKSAWPLAALSKEAPKELKSARQLYLVHARKIYGKAASGIVTATTKITDLLEARQISETKAGQIEEANALAALRKNFLESERYLSARELAAQVGRRSVPAFQIRREPDGLEVLLFPDDAGKISKNSPVANVREATGEGKELGDSGARTLGEFMGLDGGKADPLVLYHNTFDKKESQGVRWIGVKLKTGKDEEVGTYLKLTIDNTKDVMGTIDDCLPVRGSYRLSGTYKLDTPGKAYDGMILQHGQGQRIGGNVIGATKAGAWNTFSIESKALTPTSRMLIYFSRKAEKTPQQALGDSLLLADLKVEVLDRSSLVVTKFSEDGEVESSERDPSKQLLFFGGGKFQQGAKEGK